MWGINSIAAVRGVRHRLRRANRYGTVEKNKNLTRAAEPATRGVDMEVPDWADSWQL